MGAPLSSSLAVHDQLLGRLTFTAFIICIHPSVNPSTKLTNPVAAQTAQPSPPPYLTRPYQPNPQPLHPVYRFATDGGGSVSMISGRASRCASIVVTRSAKNVCLTNDACAAPPCVCATRRSAGGRRSRAEYHRPTPPRWRRPHASRTFLGCSPLAQRASTSASDSQARHISPYMVYIHVGGKREIHSFDDDDNPWSLHSRSWTSWTWTDCPHSVNPPILPLVPVSSTM